jgi:hypothetical protein
MDGLSEREMLEAWLEFHRTTLLLKTEGVEPVSLKSHMTDWFAIDS